MTNSGNNAMTRADLERLLDVYGSDRSRWPVDERAGAGQLVARDKAARRLLGEAEALDRVLERAPLPSLAREAALVDRIVAAAQRSPRMVRIEEAREPAPPAARAALPRNVVRWPGARSRPQWLQLSDTGRIAGMLAACLVFGVYVGLSSATQGTLQRIAGVAIDAGSTSLAFAQLDPLDEDLL